MPFHFAGCDVERSTSAPPLRHSRRTCHQQQPNGHLQDLHATVLAPVSGCEQDHAGRLAYGNAGSTLAAKDLAAIVVQAAFHQALGAIAVQWHVAGPVW